MPYEGVPTVRKRLLGSRLKQHREALGLTVDQVAAKLDVHKSTISRQESGHVSVSKSDLESLLDLYQITDCEIRERLETFRQQGRKRGTWHDYGPGVGPTMLDLADAESLAKELRGWEPSFVPGILQTTDYTRIVLEQGAVIGRSADDIANMVRWREHRKRVTLERESLRIWAVIDEAAVRRLIGGPAVMREQLIHLVALGDRPNINIQMLPFEAGAHLGDAGSFEILAFGDGTSNSVMYLENITPGLIIDEEHRVADYRKRIDVMSAQALSMDLTRGYLLRVMNDL